MAPFDTLTGDSVLAEFDALVSRGISHDAAPPAARRENAAAMPERRAVNWANALAKIAEEIQQRQGRRQAETILRTVGGRIARDLLAPLPESRDAFEPAVNRAFSSLDWGWVAITESADAILFEHRAPWPFENRTSHLSAVLEGFFSDTLQRLAGDPAAAVRATGKRGGVLTFEWRPPPVVEQVEEADAEPEAAPEAAPPVVEPADLVAMAEAVPPLELESELESDPKPALEEDEPPAPPRLARPAFAQWRQRHLLVTASSERAPVSPLLVAAIVFLGLFSLGLLTGGGDVAGEALNGLTQMIGIVPASGSTASGLESRAQAGDEAAQVQLGLGLLKDADPDYAAAANWFHRAADTGAADAQYDLGVLSEAGLGVKQDPVEAAILFTSAAASGHAMAQYRLGVAYEQGLGVKRNATNAAMWYEHAARQGVRAAQTALARLYATGTGVTADPVTAYAWYRLAEENGDLDARDALAPLWAAMSVAQRTDARRQALALIGDVGTRDQSSSSAHASIDQLLNRAS